MRRVLSRDPVAPPLTQMASSRVNVVREPAARALAHSLVR
jgi:hypothetical protein